MSGTHYAEGVENSQTPRTDKSVGWVPYKPTTAINSKLFWKGGMLEDHFGCFGLSPIIPIFPLGCGCNPA